MATRRLFGGLAQRSYSIPRPAVEQYTNPGLITGAEIHSKPSPAAKCSTGYFNSSPRANGVTSHFRRYLATSSKGAADEDPEPASKAEADNLKGVRKEANEGRKKGANIDSDLNARVYRAQLNAKEIHDAKEIGYSIDGPARAGESPMKPKVPIFAVIQVGAHQFKVSCGDRIVVEKLKYADVNQKVSEPLVRVLRLVDGERNPMGYLYEAMDVAKEAIANYYGKNQRKYEPIWRIIDRRWNKTLHRHIHAAAYYLNPKFFYSDSFKADEEVMDGLHSFMLSYSDLMNLDELYLSSAHLGSSSHKNATGRLFSAPLCIKRRYTSQPDVWWEDYGAKTPNLQRLAIRILSQPCSATGCERNWSMFEAVHTKKRNRLATQRLNDLVFVRYNLRLRVKQVEGDQSYDAIDLDEIDPYADWVADDVAVDPMLTTKDIADIEREAEEALASGAAEASGGFGEDLYDDEEYLPSSSRRQPHQTYSRRH